MLQAMTDQDYVRRVAQDPRPAVVLFHSPTCHYCHMVEPILERLSARYGQDALFVSVDTTTNQALPSAYGIRGVPITVLLDASGTEVGRVEGYRPESVFADLFARYFGH